MNANEMNIATQIDGERIARETADYVWAVEEIRKRRSPVTFWLTLILMAMGSAWGSWVNRSDDPRMHMILAIATGIAVFVSVSTAAECIRLRRQLDAVLVLVRKQLAHTESTNLEHNEKS